jgi:hypothetical protein
VQETITETAEAPKHSSDYSRPHTAATNKAGRPSQSPLDPPATWGREEEHRTARETTHTAKLEEQKHRKPETVTNTALSPHRWKTDHPQANHYHRAGPSRCHRILSQLTLSTQHAQCNVFMFIIMFIALLIFVDDFVGDFVVAPERMR